MPSDSSGIYSAIAFLLGIGLLLAAVFFPFAATPVAWTYEYQVEEVSPDHPRLSGTLIRPETTEACYPDNDDCEALYRVKEEGSQVISDTMYRATRGLSWETKLIIFPDAESHKFYKPAATRYDNDSTRVELAPVSNETALELASTPAREYGGGIERLVEEGMVRTNHPLTGFDHWEHTDAMLSHEGEYYRQGRYTYRGSQEHNDEMLRMVLLALGAVCFAYVGSRAE